MPVSIIAEQRHQDQAWLLDSQRVFWAALTGGEYVRAHEVFLEVVNRCAQGLILAHRRGEAMPDVSDPCWEQWAKEDTARYCPHCGGTRPDAVMQKLKG